MVLLNFLSVYRHFTPVTMPKGQGLGSGVRAWGQGQGLDSGARSQGQASSSMAKAHLEQEVVWELGHASRGAHVFHGLALRGHIVGSGGRDDVTITVVITFVTGGGFDDH